MASKTIDEHERAQSAGNASCDREVAADVYGRVPTYRMKLVNSSHSRLSAWKIFAQDFSCALLGRGWRPLTCLLVSMLSRIRMKIFPSSDV